MPDSYFTTGPQNEVEYLAYVSYTLLTNSGVTHLLVNYVTIPPCQPCEALAEVPGTKEYNSTVFKDLPAPWQ